MPETTCRTVAVDLPEPAATTLAEAAALFDCDLATLIREAAIAYAGDLAWRRARFGLQHPYRPGPPTADLPPGFRVCGTTNEVATTQGRAR